MGGGVISWSERRRPTRHQREEGGHAWLQVLRDRKWVEMCVDWDDEYYACSWTRRAHVLMEMGGETAHTHRHSTGRPTRQQREVD